MNLALFVLYLLVLFGVWTYLLGGMAMAGTGIGTIVLIGLGVYLKASVQSRRAKR